MANHVVLELDTTPPTINVYAPRYTIGNAISVITVESNEKLAHYQDITLIDSENNTHPLTFQRVSDTSYVGEVNFNNLPLGEVYINVRMKDEVDNLSLISSAIIEIKNSLELIRVKARDMKLIESTLSSQSMTVKLKDTNI